MARSGKEVATDGNMGGKNGNALSDSGHIHAVMPAVARGRGCAIWSRYAVVQVRVVRGGATAIELNYHKDSGVSRM